MTGAISTSILELESDADWMNLLQSVSGDDLPGAAVSNIIEKLRAAGAKSALVENDYLDRDYSDEFSVFYSRLFQRYRRHTRRLHFFRGNLAGAVAQGGFMGVIEAMNEARSTKEYLGFVVFRPVLDAPVGRAVLEFVDAPKGLTPCVQVRANYVTHPLGVDLTTWGMPFTQQDQRISACAQASIWMSGRHFHAKHGGPWFSTAAITEAASKPIDLLLSSSLPAGSSGLGLNNMLRALRAMDRYPYAYAGEITDNGVVWPNALSPQAMIARYVGSGIPVIAGLGPWQAGQSDGHAVVIVGDVFESVEKPEFHTSRPTLADLSPYFLVHDDQRGPYLRMPLKPGLSEGETPYNVQEHLRFLIVPLPDKVYITAETAEIKAWDRLIFYQREWPGLEAKHADAIGDASVRAATEALGALTENRVIARTYLTMGWKYKSRIQRSVASPALRSRIAAHELPRMVWVTEFGTVAQLNHSDWSKRRIFGHCVTDATSTGFSRPLIVHMPGFLWLTISQNPDFFAQSEEELFPIADDTDYPARARELAR